VCRRYIRYSRSRVVFASTVPLPPSVIAIRQFHSFVRCAHLDSNQEGKNEQAEQPIGREEQGSRNARIQEAGSQER